MLLKHRCPCDEVLVVAAAIAALRVLRLMCVEDARDVSAFATQRTVALEAIVGGIRRRMSCCLCRDSKLL